MEAPVVRLMENLFSSDMTQSTFLCYEQRRDEDNQSRGCASPKKFQGHLQVGSRQRSLSVSGGTRAVFTLGVYKINTNRRLAV